MTLTTTIPAIERTLVLRASPERVWRALTDSDELSQWVGQRADLRGTRRRVAQEFRVS